MEQCTKCGAVIELSNCSYQDCPNRDKSRSPAGSMTDDEAAKVAWEEVKKDCDLNGLPVGELMNYHGFFMWGWSYRKQLDEQRIKA